MRIFLFIGLTAFLIGCNTSKELNNVSSDVLTTEEVVDEQIGAQEEAPLTMESEESVVKPERPAFVRGQLGEINAKTDAYEITSARIDGDILYLTVTYSGGCADHKFKCIGSEAIAKSNPPRRAIKLVHDAGGDACESIVTRSIEIDIVPFAASAAGPSEILLDLDGFSQPLNFKH